jgi:hypothetical protein
MAMARKEGARLYGMTSDLDRGLLVTWLRWEGIEVDETLLALMARC